jgi:NitT/TauT family transport system permease protein
MWWAVALVFDRPRIVPAPPEVVSELLEIVAGQGPFGSSYTHLGATLFRLSVALGVSVVLGTALGILAGRVKVVFDLLDNLVWIFLSVPSVVWVFIFAVVFGVGNLVPIAALVAILAPMMLANVAEGAKSVPRDLYEMSRAFRADLSLRVGWLYIPYLLPYILGGARNAFALGMKMVLIAEVIGIPRGVGFLVLYWRDQVFMAPIVAWGVIFICMGLLFDYAVFGQLERRVAKWRDQVPGAVTARPEMAA